ncbi:cysteine proteinase [Tricholoma matsutake]|nr:cysteine proteinase [Tricholoma matsutake 945]
MAASKKSKLKKPLPAQPVASSPPVDQENDGLINDLLAQLDSRAPDALSESTTAQNDVHIDQVDQTEASGKQGAKSRFKARQARKAAALTHTYLPEDPAAQDRLEKEAKDEERDIFRVCNEFLLQVHEINPDGHCLFSAIADQLTLLGVLSSAQATYTTIRQTAAQYMFSHPDDFIPFLPAVGEDSGGADTGLMTRDAFEQYCASVRDTALWGGEPEIMALSRAYNIPIHVIQGGRPPIVMFNPSSAPSAKVDDNRVLRISYHRRMYGLGEHYNSLRPMGTLSQLSKKMQTLLSSGQ